MSSLVERYPLCYLDRLSICWKTCNVIEKPYIHSLLETHVSHIPSDLINVILSYHDLVLVRFMVPQEELMLLYEAKIMDRIEWNSLYQRIREKKMYYHGRWFSISHEKLLTSISISGHPNDITIFLTEYPNGWHYKWDKDWDFLLTLSEG